MLTPSPQSSVHSSNCLNLPLPTNWEKQLSLSEAAGVSHDTVLKSVEGTCCSRGETTKKHGGFSITLICSEAKKENSFSRGQQSWRERIQSSLPYTIPHWKRMPCPALAVCVRDGTTLSLPPASPTAMLSPLKEPSSSHSAQIRGRVVDWATRSPCETPTVHNNYWEPAARPSKVSTRTAPVQCSPPATEPQKTPGQESKATEWRQRLWKPEPSDQERGS